MLSSSVQIQHKPSHLSWSSWFIKKSSQGTCSMKKSVLKNFLEFTAQLSWNGWFTKKQHRICSIKKDVLKNFAKFIGKHLCRSVFLTKLQILYKYSFSTTHEYAILHGRSHSGARGIMSPSPSLQFLHQASSTVLVSNYGDISRLLPCMLQFLYKLWRFSIFYNYIWEIDCFTLELLKTSDT